MIFKKTVTAVTVFVLCGFLWACGTEDGLLLDGAGHSADSTQIIVETDTSEAEETILVYVCGAVQTPGVYELSPEGRICDAIAAAGGFSEGAAEDYLNQAEPVSDGEKVYIPTRKEVGEMSTSGDGVADSRVNINTADETQLETLTGIGETRAKAIIAYRESHGQFSSVDQIVNVSGIGDSTYEKIKDYIRVE